MSVIIVEADQTREEEITYADPTFYKRKAQKSVRSFMTILCLYFSTESDLDVCMSADLCLCFCVMDDHAHNSSRSEILDMFFVFLINDPQYLDKHICDVNMSVFNYRKLKWRRMWCTLESL